MKAYPVSDHAILRWLERVKGMDLDAVRAEIATPDVCAAVAAGVRKVVRDDYTIVIQGGCVITILGPEMRPKRQRRVPRSRDVTDAQAIREATRG